LKELLIIYSVVKQLSPEAEKLKIEGNALFGQGKFVEAIEKYTLAVSTAYSL
jgi:hypothetical protein